jgi:hypothetical protein
MFRFAVDATRIVSDTDCFCVGACPQGCGIELATPIASDVVEYLQDKHIPAKELVIISQPQGTNDRAINGSQAANGLAYGIAIDPLVRRYPQVHLFLAMPMGLAILLDTVGMPCPAQPSTRISSSSDTSRPSPPNLVSIEAARSNFCCLAILLATSLIIPYYHDDDRRL